MNKSNKASLVTAAIFGLLSMVPRCSASLIASVSPSSQTAQVGATPSASVLLSNSANTSNSVSGFQFDIAFDPNILQARSVTEQGFFASNGFFFSPGAIDNTAGSITFVADVTSGGQTENPSPADTLVRILFQAVRPGTSVIGVRNPVFLDGSLNAISTRTVDGQIMVTQTSTAPEPQTWFFVSGGLAALALFRFRRTV